MTRILAVLGSVFAVGYHILFDPSPRPEASAWSTWDIGALAIYGLVGFAIGWVVAIAISRIGPDK